MPKPTAIANLEIDNDLLLAGDEAPLVPLPNNVSIPPYLIFYHPQMKASAEIITSVGKAVKTGTPLLAKNGEYSVLNPLRFLFYPKFYHFMAKLDPLGEITSTMPADSGFTFDRTWTEFVETIVILIVNGRLEPCNARFKTAKVQGWKHALNTMVSCQRPDWADSKDKQAIKKLAPVYWMYYSFVGTIEHVEAKPPKRQYSYDVLHTADELMTLDLFEKVASEWKQAEPQLKDCLEKLAVEIDGHKSLQYQPEEKK